MIGSQVDHSDGLVNEPYSMSNAHEQDHIF